MNDLTEEITKKKQVGNVSIVPKKQKPPTKKETKTEIVEEENIDTVPAAKETKKQPLDLNEILNSSSFNLEDISVVDVDLSVLESTLNKITLDTTPFKQVPCLQSGYMAHMTSATLSDIDSMSEIDADDYQIQLNLYRIVYNLMIGTSIGNISFDDFMRITSLYDLDTLIFGIYAKSFPEPTNVTILCHNLIENNGTRTVCSHENKVAIENDDLIQIANDDIYVEIKKLIATNVDPKELVKKSLVTKLTRKALYGNKVIIETHIPSLKDHLDLLKLSLTYTEVMKKESSVGDILLHTKRLFVLDEEKTLKNAKATYMKIDNKEKIYLFVKAMDPKVGIEITNYIKVLDEKYIIGYTTPSTKCGNCNNTIEGIPVSVTDWLFQYVLKNKR